MGDSVPIGDKIKLIAMVPVLNAEIRLLRNGKQLETVNNNEAEFIVTEQGVYRVEVYLNGKAWIFSNHIRIGL